MTCAGDDSEFCGGSGTISLYQKCSGDSCTNAQFGPSSSAPVDVANPPPAASSSSVSAAAPAAPSSPSSSGPYTTPSSPTTLATVATSSAAGATETPESATATPVSVNTNSAYSSGDDQDDNAYYTNSGSVYPPAVASSAGGSDAADASSFPTSTIFTSAFGTTTLQYLYTTPSLLTSSCTTPTSDAAPVPS